MEIGAVAEQDIVIAQGSRFLYTVQVTSFDLAGYSARGMVRPDKVSTTLYADLSTYLTVNAVAGQVVCQVDGSVTATYDFDNGRYDIEVFKTGSSPIRIVQGNVRLDREVTR